VRLIDELPAVFGDLPVGEITAPSRAAAAEGVAGLVYGGDDPGLTKTVRAGQPRQTRTNDDDAKSWIGLELRQARLEEPRGTAGVAARGESRRREADPDELSAVEPDGSTLVENVIDGDVAVRRFSGNATRPNQSFENSRNPRTSIPKTSPSSSLLRRVFAARFR